MKTVKTVAISLALLPHLLFADVSAVGVGETSFKAKKEALSALSQIIKSDVRTSIEVIDREKGSKYSSDVKSHIKISSNLPILGTDFVTLSSNDDYKIEAKLISKNVNKLYKDKLQQLKNEMRSSKLAIRGSSSNSLKLEMYQNLNSLLNEYDRYESVATILGVKNIRRPLLTHSKIKNEILKLHSNINSLDMATTILAESFPQKSIFVKPPTLEHNSNVAEFGSLFQKKLQSKIKNSSSYKNASYILIGEYVLSQKSMILSYTLIKSSTKESLKTKTITINKRAYKDFVTKPKGVDFNTLLNSGIAQSSDLKVSLSSNRGTEQLLFNKGDEVELFVKLNKKGYLYIVGYTQTDAGKLSYLLELNEGRGDTKFIKFINADDASRWISLGAFDVAEPFGIESLQVIASNKKLRKLPTTQYDENLGYYIVSNNIKKALVKTRGLRPKRTKKVETSEDVMSFRTMK